MPRRRDILRYTVVLKNLCWQGIGALDCFPLYQQSLFGFFNHKSESISSLYSGELGTCEILVSFLQQTILILFKIFKYSWFQSMGRSGFATKLQCRLLKEMF